MRRVNLQRFHLQSAFSARERTFERLYKTASVQRTIGKLRGKVELAGGATTGAAGRGERG